MPGGLTGPTPKDPNARRRRNATVAMTQLPAGGYAGEIPEWPLKLPPEEAGSGRMHRRELEIWRQLWRTPQAAAWAKNRWAGDAARYARYQALSEVAEWGLAMKAAAEARMLEDRLGLNAVAMLKLRWEVSTDELDEKRQEKAAAPVVTEDEVARRRRLMAGGAG